MVKGQFGANPTQLYQHSLGREEEGGRVLTETTLRIQFTDSVLISVCSKNRFHDLRCERRLFSLSARQVIQYSL